MRPVQSIETFNNKSFFQLDIEKFNRQYAPIEVVESSRFHDRFLIIDETVYHIGASLKDLGKKLFAFSKMDVPKEWLEP